MSEGARAGRRASARALGPLLIALFLTAACGGPEAELIAREQVVAPPDEVPPATRGRVSVVDGELVTDIGTPLRGLLLPVDVGYELEDFELMRTIADTTGLNTVHVYLENYSQTTGDKHLEADALVALTAQAGLYLVIGIGGGPDADDHPGNGWFSAEKVRDFWNYYGPRYADSTHVLYEIQNNPQLSCADPLAPGTIELERSTYQLIRRVAPSTHVLMFSTNTVPQPAVILRAIDDVSDVVSFGNASFAMHFDAPCVPLGELDTVVELAKAKQVPLLFSQLPVEDWQPVVARAEQHRIGWMHHQWLTFDTKLSTLRAAFTDADISWCPDRGTYPQPAEGCR